MNKNINLLAGLLVYPAFTHALGRLVGVGPGRLFKCSLEV